MIKINASADAWSLAWQLPIIQSADAFPRQVSSLLFQSPILLVKLELLGGFHSQRLAGYLNQRIDTGLIGAGIYGARAGRSKQIFVDELQIVLFEIESDYTLTFDLLTYIASDGNLTVWEYTGIIA